MEKQNNWQYSFIKTKEHPLSQKYPESLETINAIVDREGCRKKNFKDEVSINLDRIERTLAKNNKRNPNKTMDMSFCIANGNKTNMVLVELRLNYTEVRNIHKSEIDGKIKYSKNIIPTETIIHKTYYFLFADSIKQQAYSRIRRLYSNKPSHIALGLKEFKHLLFN